MRQLYVFGIGNVIVIRCYNTCFAIKNSDGEYFMVDTGGENGILRVLEDMNVDVKRIHHIFLIHEYMNHLFGIVWLVRMISVLMRKELYDGSLYIHCHEDLVEAVATVCRLTLQPKFFKTIGDTIHLVAAKNGETRQILSWSVTSLDIHPTKAKQFGLTMVPEQGRRLTYAGDEPYNPLCEKFVAGSDWLLHEAFYPYGDRERFNPYEKYHSIVKDACQLAEELHIPNLVLWHMEDKSLGTRKETYMAERMQHHRGNLSTPYGGEILEL